MTLERALSLCDQPISASRSQVVKLDRFALIQMLDEYRKAAPLALSVPGLESRIRNLEATIKDMRDEASKEQNN